MIQDSLKFGLTKYTLDHFFEKVVETYAGRPALASMDEEPFTYAEFGSRVTKLRNELLSLGLKKGDKIAILGNGCPNWAIAFLSVMTMGAVAVPIMEDFPETDIDHILAHSDAAGLFISEALYQSLNLTNVGKLPHVIKLDDFSSLSRQDSGSGIWTQFQKIPQKLRSIIRQARPEIGRAHV